MFRALKQIFAIDELRGRIVFTLLMIAVCRVGAFITVPGINSHEVINLFKYYSGGGQNLFQLVDIFTGGAFAQMTIIALGVMPYISASIILQVLTMIIPSLQREVKENGEQGKRKIGRLVRFVTLALALFQSCIFARYAIGMNASTPGILYNSIIGPQIMGFPWLFYLLTIVTMTTGTLFLMWIGELITDRGIGNGMSIIITIGILASLPATIGAILKGLNLDSQEAGSLTLTSLVVLAVVFVSIIVGTIYIIQGVRKIPLQYARRGISSTDTAKTSTSFMPLKVNFAGVIPVIFASTFLMFPATVARLFGTDHFMAKVANQLSPGTWVYTVLFVISIIAFTFFWTATQFHPDQIASDMKKSGAFIPGVRQGKATEEYLETKMRRITYIGATFLAIMAVLPTIVARLFAVDYTISHFFGGTSLLIFVGAILDTVRQVDSNLIMHKYDGFMTQKKIKYKL